MKQGKKMAKKSLKKNGSPNEEVPKTKKKRSPSNSWTHKLKDIIKQMKNSDMNINNFEDLYKLEGVKQKMTRHEYKKHITK